MFKEHGPLKFQMPSIPLSVGGARLFVKLWYSREVRRAFLVFGILMAGFLGFVAQPIVAKFTLPLLGGGGGVWTLVSIAFQGGLLLGYCYALWMINQTRSRQLIIHSSLGAISLFALAVPSGILTGELHAWTVWTGVALSYFMLSSTSPLVQGWIGGKMTISELRPVYRLFSYSNLAAICGLFAYPFFVEPSIGWLAQIRIWVLFYAVYLAVILAVAWRECVQINSKKEAIAGGTRGLYWLTIPLLSTSYLLAMSFAFSQNIPPSPLIWAVPLALYLLSYAVAFAGWIGKIFKAVLLALLALWVSGLLLGGTEAGGLNWEIFPAHCVVFFAGCLILHGMLFDSRPSGEGLARFYALMASGGFLGGVFSLTAVPRLFPGGDEIWLFHLIPGVLSLAGLATFFFKQLRGWGELAMGVSLSFLLFFFAISEKREVGGGLNKRIRNFHGAFRVQDNAGWSLQRDLIHGGTAHGSQSRVIGEGGIPTTYYTRNSGVGAAGAWFRQKNHKTTMLCVGIGAGTIASWGGNGDKIYFVDIDKDMISVAQEDFSFIKDAQSRGAEVAVILGDGRISLAKIPDGSVDFFILDAFNGGGIPIHLLTKEAFLEYSRILSKQGVMAIHVSSRALRLPDVVAGGLREIGLSPVVLESNGGAIGTPSVWTIAAKQHEVVREIANMHEGEIAKVREVPGWTDDFSSIYTLFK